MFGRYPKEIDSSLCMRKILITYIHRIQDRVKCLIEKVYSIVILLSLFRVFKRSAVVKGDGAGVQVSDPNTEGVGRTGWCRGDPFMKGKIIRGGES